VKIRVRHRKLGPLVFLSQLDLLNTMLQALRRAGIPFALSEGFNPKPRISYGLPLPVGAGSLAEYFDLILKEVVAPGQLKEKLQAQLPEFLRVEKLWEIADREPAIQARVCAADYYIWMPVLDAGAQEHIEDFLVQKQWNFLDRRGREKDLKKLVWEIEFLKIKQGLAGFKITAAAGSRENLRPGDFCELIKKSAKGSIGSPGRILRCELYYRGSGGLLTPFSGG